MSYIFFADEAAKTVLSCTDNRIHNMGHIFGFHLNYGGISAMIKKEQIGEHVRILGADRAISAGFIELTYKMQGQHHAIAHSVATPLGIEAVRCFEKLRGWDSVCRCMAPADVSAKYAMSQMTNNGFYMLLEKIHLIDDLGVDPEVAEFFKQASTLSAIGNYDRDEIVSKIF